MWWAGHYQTGIHHSVNTTINTLCKLAVLLTIKYMYLSSKGKEGNTCNPLSSMINTCFNMLKIKL